jgi:hypothetical protein
VTGSATTSWTPPRQRSVLVAGDALRAAAAVSVLVGLTWSGAVAGALFFLVLGGTMLARALALPTVLDLSFCATVLFGAWAAELDWYVAVPWLDLVVHAGATGLVAAVAHVTLVRAGAVASVDASALRRPRLGGWVVTCACGIALATLWEMGEWFGHTYLDDRIQVGYADTVGDLAAGTVGSMVAGALLAGGLRLAGGRR